MDEHGLRVDGVSGRAPPQSRSARSTCSQRCTIRSGSRCRCKRRQELVRRASLLSTSSASRTTSTRSSSTICRRSRRSHRTTWCMIDSLSKRVAPGVTLGWAAGADAPGAAHGRGDPRQRARAVRARARAGRPLDSGRHGRAPGPGQAPRRGRRDSDCCARLSRPDDPGGSARLSRVGGIAGRVARRILHRRRGRTRHRGGAGAPHSRWAPATRRMPCGWRWRVRRSKCLSRVSEC